MPDHPWTPAFTGEVAIRDGIYRVLRPERLSQIEPLLAQYRRIRAADGYRQRSDAYYRALPRVDPHDPQAATWRVRQESFRNLGRVLRRFNGRRLRILDLGAGSGWLSARLTMRGHCCVAVDWLDDDEDGLGAVRHYEIGFTCVQADFEELPIAPGQFDAAIFNASLHYATDPGKTLRDVCEMLVPGGIVVVMDSPVFASDDAGRRMLNAQQTVFQATTGSAVRWGVGYLTKSSLSTAARDAGLTARWLPSRGGFRWAIKRWIAGVKQARTPAAFGLWIAEPATS
jgi:SAM-dependent methyltransferase